MKKVRKESILKSIGEVFPIFLVAIPFLLLCIVIMSQPEEKALQLTEVDFTGDIKGLYVNGTIYNVYGVYAEVLEGDKVVGYEFLIDAGDSAYMGLRIKSNDKLIKDDLISNGFFEVTGTICAMEDEMVEIFHKAVEWEMLLEEERTFFYHMI